MGRHQPLKFYGTETNSVSAQDWLEAIEETMELFVIVSTLWCPLDKQITWAMFREAFEREFLATYTLYVQAQKYLNLRENYMMVKVFSTKLMHYHNILLL